MHFFLSLLSFSEMLTVNLRNDFLLKDSKQQDCPEREAQVASDLMVEFMTDARILSHGCMKENSEQQKKDIKLLFWIILYRHVSSLVRAPAYMYYVGKLHVFKVV